MKYSTVLFDADGTLLDFKRSEDEAVREMFKLFDISANDDMVKKYSDINDSLWKALERREIEKNVLLYHRFELFCNHYGFVRDYKKMAQTYMNTLSTKSYIIAGADALCRKLYDNVKMHIVTNGVDFIQKGRFSTCPITKYFDNIFVSGVLGYEKPDVKYFEAVEKIISIDKKSTLIVGDSLTSDIKGGIDYGIDNCWYNPNNKPVPNDMNITHVATSFDDIYNIISNESEF